MTPHRILWRAATPEQLMGLARPDQGPRRLLAWTLRRLAWALARTARWLAPQHPPVRQLERPPPDDLPLVEYHGQAGAPEGALYVNGQFIGRLDVDRL